MGTVIAVNISELKGTQKKSVPSIEIKGDGVAGDAHAGPGRRQVSLLAREVIDQFSANIGRTIENGEFAENITTEGIDMEQIGLLDHLKVGDAELEVLQLGKECHGDGCAIFRELGKCVMPKAGIFCAVVKGAEVMPGDAVEHLPRPFRCLVVTASDRAKEGVYEDKSGPEVEELLTRHLEERRWHPEVTRSLVADDTAALTSELESFAAENGDVVIITGGTGVGPRDVTPEAVSEFCDKLIPGIMESIRAKYGSDKPSALLSRSVAGVKGRMLVYAIPGSVRAVREYMSEILKSMEHAVLMLHQVDAH